MSWSKSFKLPDHHTSYSIGLATLPDNRLVCVHRGARADTSLWWTIADSKGWGKDQQFPKHHSANGASLAMYDGALHCVHRGGISDDWLYHTVYDAAKNSWSEDKVQRDMRSNQNPAIAPYTDKDGQQWLFCVHRGWEKDDRLWYSKYDGHGWTKTKPISEDGHHSWGAPALALYQGVLYCVHRGNYGNDNLYYTSFNGQWSADEVLPDHHMGDDESHPGSVAIASDGKLLYCVHKGAVGDNNIWWTHFNGRTWSNDEKTGSGGRYVSLTAVTNPNRLFCVHQGYGLDDNLHYMEKSL